MNQPVSNHATAADELLRSDADLLRVPLGDGSELVYSATSGAQHVLPAVVVHILQACRTFATLDEHAARIGWQAGLPAHQIRDLRAQLASLFEMGLMVSHRSIIEHCKRADRSGMSSISEADGSSSEADGSSSEADGSSSEADGSSSEADGSSSEPASRIELPGASRPSRQITSMGVPTRNRPENLGLCLSSYAECTRVFELSIRFTVGDQSTAEETCEANRKELKTVSKKFGVEIFHITESDRQEFVRLLASDFDVPKELSQFALLDNGFPFVAGANRNALLLASAGELTVQADDDTLCRMAPSDERQPGITLTSQPDPTEIWFLDEDETSTISDEFTMANFFAIHEQLLGRTLGQSLSEIAPDLVNMDATQSSFFHRPEDSRVILSAIGTTGDSAIGSSAAFIATSGKTRQRLLNSEGSYRHARESHQISRAVLNQTINEGGLCMGVNLGLDNRVGLPPFIPMFRGEDSIYSAVLRACGHSLFGYLPYRLLHRPPQSKRLEWKRRRAMQFGFASVLEQLIIALVSKNSLERGLRQGRQQPGLKQNMRQGMKSLGSLLIGLGNSPASEFNELVRITMWDNASHQLVALEALLNRFDRQPDYWVGDVMALQSSIQATMDCDLVIPGDIVELFGRDQGPSVFQRLIGQYGELLFHWPDLFDAAIKLKSQGWHLGTKV